MLIVENDDFLSDFCFDSEIVIAIFDICRDDDNSGEIKA